MGIFPFGRDFARGVQPCSAKYEDGSKEGGGGEQKGGVTLSSSPEFNKLSFLPLLLEIRIHGRHIRQTGPLN